MSLTKSKQEQELFEFYKKYLKDPSLIDENVIRAYKQDVKHITKPKK